MFLVQNIYFPYNTIKYFEYGQDLAEGSLAEWSKALVLGTSPKGRGFESHSCQNIFYKLKSFQIIAFASPGAGVLLGKCVHIASPSPNVAPPQVFEAGRKNQTGLMV